MKIIGKIWRKMPRFWRMKVIRLTQDTFTVSVAAVIINEDGKVLLLNHVLRPASGWGIPGGFVEHNEQPEHAVCRELREETGLELENVKLFSVRILKSHVEFIYESTAKGTAEVKSREILSLDWFAPDEMPEQMSPVQKACVREVLNYKKTKS